MTKDFCYFWDWLFIWSVTESSSLIQNICIQTGMEWHHYFSSRTWLPSFLLAPSMNTNVFWYLCMNKWENKFLPEDLLVDLSRFWRFSSEKMSFHSESALLYNDYLKQLYCTYTFIIHNIWSLHSGDDSHSLVGGY